MNTLDEAYKAWYSALRREYPEAYRKAIEYAEGISIMHSLNHKLAAEIEMSHVVLACELLGVEAP